MRVFRFLSTGILLVSVAACSKTGKGGVGGADGSGMGDGNIPLAEAGKELGDVNFDFDSSSLDDSAQGVLSSNARWLHDNPNVQVVVEGHCDERGTAEYNMALGERRAHSVKEYLNSLGVKSDRLSTISYGEELPLDSGHDEGAWAKNRRAHFAMK
ncbi:MAG: peptidoglycan-associated lipoprotein Pal [Deltaproteobacteria bacterium]|nr:peptidoglycan-associated lipoprotein Pal [Deltaproteobacteria bacterium]